MRSKSIGHPKATGGEGEEYRRILEYSVAVRIELLERAAPSLLSWSVAYRLEEGRRLDFELFPFQRELYEAFGDRDLATVDVMKSAQCGVSAAGVSLALYAADRWNAGVLYVLPTSELARDLSDTRVRRAISDSCYLRSLVTETDRTGLKRLRDTYLYFTDSGSERQALSRPADLLILDEYDRLTRANIPKFESRLNALTSMRLLRRFSNPSYPEDGIHGRYLDSDQRQWLVRCGSCRREAPIFYDSLDDSHYLDEERVARVCGRCHRVLRPARIAAGRWVPARRDQVLRGYHVSRLISPGDDMATLVANHARGSESEISAHFNFDLGLPYAAKGGSLDADQVNACRREWSFPSSYQGRQWVTAGVDVGAVLHVRISEWTDQGAVPLWIGELPDFESLAQKWMAYNVNFGLIDERPEERKARDFTERFPGRAYLVRWSGEDQRDEVVKDSDRRLVIARRTWSCDQTVASFASQERLLPKELPEHYTSQLTAPHRIVEETRKGQKIGRYVSERADHYFFAETYDLLARRARPGGNPVGVTVNSISVREEVRRNQRMRLFQAGYRGA